MKKLIDIEVFRQSGRKGGRATRDKMRRERGPEWQRDNAIRAVKARWDKRKIK